MSSSSQQAGSAPITWAGADGVRDSYIVMLKDTANQSKHISWVKSLPERHQSPDVLCRIIFEYEIFKGYSAYLSEAILTEIAQSPDVKAIHQNQEAEDFAQHGGDVVIDIPHDFERPIVQNDASWGLQRISQRAPLPQGSKPEDLNYVYRDDPSGRDHQVDVYVIDSGVQVGHTDFGGRARWGILFEGATESDKTGHGTFVAGVIAGTRWGSGKAANIIAVKNRKDDSKKALIDYIAKGFEWATLEAKRTKNPSIINYCGGKEDNTLLDIAAKAALDAGVHVCVAAGNSGKDARNMSPARVPGVIAVGATDIYDCLYDGSNYGSVLTILAPGVDITSISTDEAGRIMQSGTSCAAPFVSGVMANILGKEGNMDPPKLLERIRKMGVPDVVLSDIPVGTPNLLLKNGPIAFEW